MRRIVFKYGALLFCLSAVMSVSGCVSFGVIENQSITNIHSDTGYSVSVFNDSMSKSSNGVMLAFSGGGTRAAALSYGVLQQLRDTVVSEHGQQRRLLDDVGVISSVSGGSFTAAYYGLYGDRIFNDFEDRFLRKDVERSLIRSILNPLHWFNSSGRTEYAIKFYEKEVFDNATFADMLRPDAPMVLINATDLTRGVRFTFMQEYFNFLCSDLASFPISRAVAASSAVPLLFNPVVLENHASCTNEPPSWLVAAKDRSKSDPELALTVSGMESYFDKGAHQYAHFVDGGISDNLGLRSIFDITRLAGGTKQLLEYFKIDIASRLVIISVDASTKPETRMGQSRAAPNVFSTINAMTDIQLHRYNTATVAQMKQSVEQWVGDFSDTSTPIKAYFIRLSFDDIKDPEIRSFINQIPTNFSLKDAEVDSVIKAGRDLLKENSEFQRLLADIGKL